jgi:hypothetical protein
MNRHSCIRTAAADPESILDQMLPDFARSGAAQRLLAVDFELDQYWQPAAAPLVLVALYWLRADAAGETRVAVAVCRRDAAFEAGWQELAAGRLELPGWLAANAIPHWDLQAALPLQPVIIPKPWGREIWYTGIEQRGVAAVGDDRGATPLPWLLAAAPRRLCAGLERQLILLKILDPLPTAVFGDLYFELHQQKREVYVVTEVDRRAWPDGVGGIRFGFDAERRASYGDDQRFLTDYLQAVRAYRQVRLDIDRQLDDVRQRCGVGLNDPVDAATLQRWLQEIDPQLRQREQVLRTAMEAFTALRPLRVGDVVQVPCLVPHSLQHGVRTVEFQTPVYERLILSFAQKVLTQDDWDTERAAELIRMDPPAVEPWLVTAEGEGWREQRIVEFDDFEVRRLALAAGARRLLPVPADYGLLMAVGEGLWLEAAPLRGDQALLLPGSWRGGAVENRAGAERVLLLAYPRPGASG